MFLKRVFLLRYNFHKVFVPLTYTGVKGWIFNLVCPGNAISESHEGLLLLNNATVNRNLGFDDVCKNKYAYVAYNNQYEHFVVSNITGDMVKYPVEPFLGYMNIAFEWEIQDGFFASFNIKPIWINANYSWGWYDNVTDTWTGATGMIERDEADYALWGFAYTLARSKVVAFSPGLDYMPYYWLTRYPQELSPTWNLLGLFTKGYSLQTSNLNL